VSFFAAAVAAAEASFHSAALDSKLTKRAHPPAQSVAPWGADRTARPRYTPTPFWIEIRDGRRPSPTSCFEIDPCERPGHSCRTASSAGVFSARARGGREPLARACPSLEGRRLGGRWRHPSRATAREACELAESGHRAEPAGQGRGPRRARVPRRRRANTKPAKARFRSQSDHSRRTSSSCGAATAGVCQHRAGSPTSTASEEGLAWSAKAVVNAAPAGRGADQRGGGASVECGVGGCACVRVCGARESAVLRSRAESAPIDVPRARRTTGSGRPEAGRMASAAPAVGHRGRASRRQRPGWRLQPSH